MFDWFKKSPKDKAEAKLKSSFKWWRSLPLKRDKRAVEAVDKLMENSRFDSSFLVMSGLSGALATLGILLNDTAILIAAMVLAPLLNPLLACAAGISILNRRLIIYAFKAFTGSLIFVVLISALLVFCLAEIGHSFDISAFTQKFRRFDSLLFLAAFISGFAGVYAWLKATHLSNLVGVAIAVSLIPFVSFFGVMLGLQEFTIIHEYWQPFLINLATIVVGATTAFLLLGFSRQKKVLDQEIEHNTED